MNSGNAHYYSVQELISSHLLSKNSEHQDIQDNNFASCFTSV